MLDRVPTRRLYRSRTNVVFAGVAGGIADCFAIDPTLARVLVCLVLLLASGPFASVVYAVLAAIIPQTPADVPPM